MPENLVSRDGFSRPVPRQPAHLHTQAEYGAYLRDSSRVPRRSIYETAIRHRVSPVFIGSRNCVRWRSLPRVRRHRASKPQGSSERVLPWQVTMDQLICVSLSHTQSYWYEVGMLKVPADLCWRFFPSEIANCKFPLGRKSLCLKLSERGNFRSEISDERFSTRILAEM